MDCNVNFSLLISRGQRQRIPVLHRLPANYVLGGDEDVADLLVPDVLPVHHFDLQSGGIVANWHAVLFVPNWVKAVLHEGSLQQLNLRYAQSKKILLYPMISHLIKEDSDEGISPVPTADVESKVVRVRKVTGCYHMHPEIAVLQIEQIKILTSRLPLSFENETRSLTFLYIQSFLSFTRNGMLSSSFTISWWVYFLKAAIVALFLLELSLPYYSHCPAVDVASS